MALHIHCDTPHATLLIAVQCADQLLRFPNDGSFWPGIGFKVDPVLGINEQLMSAASIHLGVIGKDLSIWQEYSAVLEHVGVMSSTLYVSKVVPKDFSVLPSAWDSWQTLPVLIRTLPKDRNRLAFLRAWQVLSGGLEESTKALDVEEVARHLKSLEIDGQ